MKVIAVSIFSIFSIFSTNLVFAKDIRVQNDAARACARISDDNQALICARAIAGKRYSSRDVIDCDSMVSPRETIRCFQLRFDVSSNDSETRVCYTKNKQNITMPSSLKGFDFNIEKYIFTNKKLTAVNYNGSISLNIKITRNQSRFESCGVKYNGQKFCHILNRRSYSTKAGKLISEQVFDDEGRVHSSSETIEVSIVKSLEAQAYDHLLKQMKERAADQTIVYAAQLFCTFLEE